MAVDELKQAQKNKKDEFYTQYQDIQKEVNAYREYNPDVFKDKTILLPCDDPEWSNFTKFFAQNFETFHLKKLISTSYAIDKKTIPQQPTLFETEDAQYDADKSKTKGKIFILDRDTNHNGVIDIDDLTWRYMDGDGDFRSREVKALRDEADIIITNPPFSLFREFVAWLMEANKKFLIIGNLNSVGCKEIFPLLMNNKIWMGQSITSGDREFGVPESYPLNASGCRIDDNGNKFIRVKGVRWYTNLEHGRRHQPMKLLSMDDNIKYNKKFIKKLKEYGSDKYIKYDNYDAIEIPYSNAIPDDYDGVMGVPITFVDKYCPDQFKILGATQRGCHDAVPDIVKYDDYWEVKQNGTKTGSSGGKTNENPNVEFNDGKHNYFVNKDGKIIQSLYTRIFIKKIK